jgi:L-ribulose-5-phosphate 3-epimerase
MRQSSLPSAVGPFGIEPGAFTRRGALKSALFAAGASLTAAAAAQTPAKPGPDDRRGSPKKYNVKKSINLWAFPYPQRMNLRECLQLAKDAGFDAIELNYDLENDLSPKSGAKEYAAIRKMADRYSNQRTVFVSFLALSAEQQR